MRRCSILIVDDSEVDRYLLKRQIQQTQLAVRVFEYNDGASALEFLRDWDSNRSLYPEDFPPVFIFLDINMPKVGGWAFLEEFCRLREALGILECSVVLFSSSSSPQDKQRALDYNCVEEYLVKGEQSPAVLERILLAS